jgi:tetratricopeptide (TPR) repeat protein
MLSTLDADNLPLELHPAPDDGVTSGTRLGAALRLAVALHDPRFQGAQDILLLSDGDDPVEDNEWAEGIEAAKSAKIPVHTVGVGDPDRASPIPFGDAFLQHGGVLVKTRLHEKPLLEIARRTGGIYLPARTSPLPLGKIFHDVIEPRGERLTSEVESTADLPLLRQRYPWFLGTALALLTGTMLIGDRKRSVRVKEPRAPADNDANSNGSASLPGSLLICFSVCLFVLGAGPVTSLIFDGNVSFAAEDYPAALDFYEQAEERTTDPGLVAFNKAAALYRLKKYREAELHFRRCLDDQQAPPVRKARAYYDLGNCLLKQAQAADAPMLERAMGFYRECLALNVPDGDLLAYAQHNLELATLLWLKAKIAAKDSPTPPDQPEDPRRTAREQRFQDEPGARKARTGDPADQAAEKADEGPDGQKPGKKNAAPGKLLNLPDQDELVPLPPEDALATLEDASRRILGEHRTYRRQAAPVSENVKDW